MRVCVCAACGVVCDVRLVSWCVVCVRCKCRAWVQCVALCGAVVCRVFVMCCVCVGCFVCVCCCCVCVLLCVPDRSNTSTAKCAFDQSSPVSDPDDLPRFPSSVFPIVFRTRRQHHCSSLKPAFDVWSHTFAFTASPEVHFVARTALCQWAVSRSRGSLESFKVLSATHLWLFPFLADVPESSDQEFRCHCRKY